MGETPHHRGSLQTRRGQGLDPSRPIAFLVSTTSTARTIRDHMGSPAYSYVFVVEALAPVLKRFGTYRLIDHPESRLAFAARQAEAEGYQAVHLAINPLQDVYLSPALPNLLFPFWEFPEIPSRDFGLDSRQNWLRTCQPAALILAACAFTAGAFRTAKVRPPIAVVPIPIEPEAFQLPDWNPDASLTFTCRHEWLGSASSSRSASCSAADQPAALTEAVSGSRKTLRGGLWRLARSGFRRVHPWMNSETVGKLTRLKRKLVASTKQSPLKLVYATTRDGYRNHVRRWLSQDALERISATKKRALAMIGREPIVVLDPPLPSAALTLKGLVYLTIFNLGDFRKNYLDILTAFLVAMKDREDATLVIKLVTNRVREHHEAGVLRAKYESIGLKHRCKVVVITEFLSDAQMDDLLRITTYYVNASHAEGACLPLMKALAGGRPAIAPAHTAMADYMDDRVGFVIQSDLEPTYWPHDPEQRLETFRYRLSWADLREAFRQSAEVADHDPNRYRELARNARQRLQNHASQDAAETALRNALASIDGQPLGAFGWPGPLAKPALKA